MAFMLEADKFNPWLEAAQGYLTHCLNAYDKNPIWTADPKNTVFREAAKRTLTAGGLGSVGEKAATAIADFVVRRHVRQLLHRPRGREGRDRDRRAAAQADLSVSLISVRRSAAEVVRCNARPSFPANRRHRISDAAVRQHREPGHGNCMTDA